MRSAIAVAWLAVATQVGAVIAPTSVAGTPFGGGAGDESTFTITDAGGDTRTGAVPIARTSA